MKTRSDFVSNSSSSSFVVLNPRDLKFDVNLLASANYVHFIDIDFGKMHKVGKTAKFAPGKTVKAFDKFKADVSKAFGTKARVGYERRDSTSSPPEEVYVELETDNFWKSYNAKKRSMIEKLIANADAIHLNFGEDYDGGIERATQVATLLDYAYNAEIESDDCDHFNYYPVEDLGVIKD